MSDEQVGVYIRMLCAQHQHGGRIDTNVLRTYCDRITNGIQVFNKFEHDATGSFNPRLEQEMILRREKSRKAAESVKKRWDKHKELDTYERNTNVIRSEDENVNEDVIEIEDKAEKKTRKRFLHPELNEVETYMKERNSVAGGLWPVEKVLSEAKKYFNYYCSNGWRVGKNPMKDWQAAARNWMNNANEYKTSTNGKQQQESELTGFRSRNAEVLRRTFGQQNGGTDEEQVYQEPGADS